MPISRQNAFSNCTASCRAPTLVLAIAFLSYELRGRAAAQLRGNTAVDPSLGQHGDGDQAFPVASARACDTNSSFFAKIYSVTDIVHCVTLKQNCLTRLFARDSIYATARMCDRNSVWPSGGLSGRSGRLSGRSSHGWIVQKRLKLGSCNFHHRVAPTL